MSTFSTFGIAAGAAYTYDWGQALDRQMKNEQMDLQAAEIKRQKVDALSNLTTESEALNGRHKEELRKYYDNLSSEMGSIFSEYEDPYSDPEAMSRMKSIGKLYQDNEILRKDRELTAERNAMKADYMAGNLDEEDYNVEEAKFQEYANNPDAEVPYVYTRPTYQNTSTVLNSIATTFNMNKGYEKGYIEVNGYTDEQFEEMTNATLSNVGTRTVIRKNLLRERKALGLSTEYEDGAQLEADLRAYIKNNLQTMYPKEKTQNASLLNAIKSNKSEEVAVSFEDTYFHTAIVAGNGLKDREIAEAFSIVPKGDALPSVDVAGKKVTEIGFGAGNEIYALRIPEAVTVSEIEMIDRTETGDYTKMSVEVTPVNLFAAATENATKAFGETPITNKIPVKDILDQSQLEELAEMIKTGASFSSMYGGLIPTDPSGKTMLSGFDVKVGKPGSWIAQDENGEITLSRDGLAYMIAIKNANTQKSSSANPYAQYGDAMQNKIVTLQGVTMPVNYSVYNINEFNKKASKPLEIRNAEERLTNQLGGVRRLGSADKTNETGSVTSPVDLYLMNSKDNLPDFSSSTDEVMYVDGKAMKPVEYFSSMFSSEGSENTDSRFYKAAESQLDRIIEELPALDAKWQYLDDELKKMKEKDGVIYDIWQSMPPGVKSDKYYAEMYAPLYRVQTLFLNKQKEIEKAAK